jgi:hypothetical protein
VLLSHCKNEVTSATSEPRKLFSLTLIDFVHKSAYDVLFRSTLGENIDGINIAIVLDYFSNLIEK